MNSHETGKKTLFVYPNTSELNRRGRGGLSARYELARNTGCEFIEMPADLIKNRSEIDLTGFTLGSVLSEQAIAALYEPGSPSTDLAYILHSEPSLPRSDGYGLSHQAALKWYAPEWVSELAEMLINIARRLSLPPAAIEIHPGDRRNSIHDLIRAIHLIQKRFQTDFGVRPLILIENRTGQFLSTGRELAAFATGLSREEDLIAAAGIVLDVQQLFTSTKSAFLEELKAIPQESVKALHVHTKHRAPSDSDRIPWKSVFEWIKEIPGNLLINPEIHHRNQVLETIKFCQTMME
jgi:hypothetical protein